MTKRTPALDKLGLTPDEAAVVAADMASGNASALANALLIYELWQLVVDETKPETLQRSGGAIARLLDQGVNIHDVLDVVREAQVDTIYNVSQLIDAPGSTLDPDADLPEVVLWASLTETDGTPERLYALHTGLMERDPTGRHGEPRTLELRAFQLMPEALRRETFGLIRDRKLSAAALVWKKHFGTSLQESLTAVQALCHQVRAESGVASIRHF